MKKLNKFIRNLVLPSILIAGVITLILFFLFSRSTFDSLEVKTLDMRFALRGPREFKSLVHVVAIDKDTIFRVGRWPWPRGVIGKLVSGICGGEQAPIEDAFGEEAPAEKPSEKPKPSNPNDPGKQSPLGIDIAFDRTDRSYKDFLLKPGDIMDPAQQDDMAVEAIGSCPAAVYVTLLKFNESCAGDNVKKYKTEDGDVCYNLPIAKYMLKNTYNGFANMQPSVYDERVRKAGLYYKTGDNQYIYSFAAMDLAAFQGLSEKDIKVEDGYVTIGKFRIPVDKDGNIYINYHGKEYKPGAGGAVLKENVHSAMDIMGKDAAWIPLTQRDNGIYLIGVTDPEIKDIFYTPYAIAGNMYPQNSVLSGIELHKEILDTILQGNYLKDASGGKVALALALGGLIVALLTLLRLWAGLISMFAYGGTYAWFTLGVFNSSGEIYPVATVLLALPLCLVAGVLYRILVVNREKNAVKNIFKSYVAPHVLAELMDNPDDLKLGGNRSKVSVLFSDIRGFTTISEGLEPDVLIKGLNHYLSEMTKIVLDNSGMIDKFIGDAVMAVWGAPVSHDCDACQAVTAAVKMQPLLEQINPTIKQLTGVTFKIGVGINTGIATLGNIGSEKKLDYTVIGDTVNLASRLEGMTKQYGAFTVISEFTYEEVKDKFDCRQLDDVKVKGKDKPVIIYQVYCEKGGLPDDVKKMLEQYNAALALYKDRKFKEAKVLFAKALEVIGDDKTCGMYIERCDYYIETPPPEDWDGSFEWKTK